MTQRTIIATRTLLVLCGGMIGTGLRAVLEALYPTTPGHFPWTTCAINIAGSFLLAILTAALAHASRSPRAAQSAQVLLGTGLLGGFTTYSTFVAETLTGAQHSTLIPLAYIVLSLLLGALAAIAGFLLVHRASRVTTMTVAAGAGTEAKAATEPTLGEAAAEHAASQNEEQAS